MPLTYLDQTFEQLKRSGSYSYADGIYYSVGDLCYTPLCSADIDLTDFHVANGRFRSTSQDVTYLALSYTTDNRKRLDGTKYLNSVPQLPNSNTHANQELQIFGETFTNIPPQASDYVTRTSLEQELRSILLNDRHPVVSLVGRGGIGKTSLALKVLHELCDEGEYEFILWFSARDIDLLSEGPKDVRPQVLTFAEIAKEFKELLTPYGIGQQDLPLDQYFARALSGQLEVGPMLFVVDNFETVTSPSELFHTLDTHVRLPNKLLITGRHHEFKADYPVEVTGMNKAEYSKLVRALTIRLGLAPPPTSRYLDALYEETGGHPYIIKVILGEVATGKQTSKVRRILATKDRLLDALFERTYATLTPGAQQVFLTLCNWRALIPQLELEAVLVRPNKEYFDTSTAVATLERYSIIEVIRASYGLAFLRVPEAARVFGKKKLSVSRKKLVIDVDTAMLQSLGPVRFGDIKDGFGRRIDQVVYSVAKRATHREDITEYMGILEYIATGYPHAWMKIAELRFENPQLGDSNAALDAMERYLQEAPYDAEAWRRLADAAHHLGRAESELNALYTLEDVSNAAECLSRHLAQGKIAVGRNEKRLMASQLAQTMDIQRDQANGTDFSRLAWLYLHLKQSEKARDCVHHGLEIDAGNTHLLKLHYRLGGGSE